MNFRTELSLKKQTSQIALGDEFITIGSCFANVMHEQLLQSKFNTVNNPLGIIYDPISIARILNYAVVRNRPNAQTYIELDNKVVNLITHSDIKGNNLDEVEKQINSQLTNLQDKLKKADWLIITLGTSWVYTFKSKGVQVANCHKIPQKEFEKSLLPFEKTKMVYDDLIQLLKTFNPNLKIILTVSPVRHTKDTLPLNNLSKAHLLILSHYLEQKYSHVQYFPSYDLLLDDLRDYRFYKSDMLHPTNQAIEYIWNYFTSSYFTSSSLSFLKEWKKIQKLLHHRPFDEKSKEHQKFIRSTILKLKSVDEKIDTSQEIMDLESKLQHAAVEG